MGTTNLDSDPIALATLSYGSQQFRQYVELAGRGREGIDASGDFLISQRAAGANMSVDFAAGRALVRGDTDADEGLYVAIQSASDNVEITAADPTNPRIDRVVLEIKNNEEDSGGAYLARIRTVDGTPTASADLSNLLGAAAVPNSCLLLANVSVPAADTTISDSQIFNVARAYMPSHMVQALRINRGSGGYLKALTFSPWECDGTGATLFDGYVSFQAIDIPENCTITGVEYVQKQQGSYTADNNNKFGLYASDGTTLVLIAETANDGNIFKVAADTPTQVAFGSAVTVPAGVYYIAAIYNRSAQTTAPILYGQDISLSAAMDDFGYTGNVGMYGILTGQTDLPDTQAHSGVTWNGTNIRMHMVGLY